MYFLSHFELSSDYCLGSTVRKLKEEEEENSLDYVIQNTPGTQKNENFLDFNVYR